AEKRFEAEKESQKQTRRAVRLGYTAIFLLILIGGVFGKKVGNAFQVEITDTGIGMSDEAIRKLFTLNASSTFGTENEKGIGLGMVLCGEIIEQHNGTIAVESGLNKGTKITVKLPIRG
ncbi:MAG: ATP-binding protein, partial [Flavobacteriales bacterium]|nr:ATP-binding protein [Flavobacteriales bacterium]